MKTSFLSVYSIEIIIFPFYYFFLLLLSMWCVIPRALRRLHFQKKNNYFYCRPMITQFHDESEALIEYRIQFLESFRVNLSQKKNCSYSERKPKITSFLISNTFMLKMVRLIQCFSRVFSLIYFWFWQIRRPLFHRCLKSLLSHIRLNGVSGMWALIVFTV